MWVFDVRPYFGLIVCAVFVSGCGVKTTRSPDGTTVSEVFLGLGSSVACGEAEGVTADITTLGLWTGQNAGLGFHQARFFCGSPKCRVVILPEAGTDVAALRKAYGDLGNVCVAGTDNEKER